MRYPAKPEYATAPIAVWWDMKDCPIPEGYDARRFRPCLEAAFKRLGYTGPVSITAYGDLKRTPDHVLRELVSTGVNVAHSAPRHICSFMFDDILEWRAHNPPPATMMLISNRRVEDVLSWDLARLQQHTYYNLVRAFSDPFLNSSKLRTTAEWLWDSLLESPDKYTTSSAVISAMFSCKTCSFDCQTLETFREHLSSKKHLLEDKTTVYGNRELDPVTRIWEKNYPAKPEYAHANIGVWWNMEDCPIPEGYDARRIRPSLEAAFRSLGYHGPVSIFAFGDQKLTPDHVLQGLSSTGINVAHSWVKTTGRMYSHMLCWKSDNPPATVMVVSDPVEHILSLCLVGLQQRPAPAKYNVCLAYSYRPCKMSVVVTCAEWLWDSLLAATVSETGESGQSTGMFRCELCNWFRDCNGLDDFRKHLARWHSREVSKQQKKEEKRLRKMQESIIPDPVSRKASSRTYATKKKKNVVASSLNSAAPPFNPSGSSSNYPATPEYATAPVGVWWDMDDCGIPEGYDVSRVRPNLEGEFKRLGYTGPVFITAYGDLKQTPDHVLRGLVSTGVTVAHSAPEHICSFMFDDILEWRAHNRPPATMMLISNRRVERVLSWDLARLQQHTYYNLVQAYSVGPVASNLRTSAEWLWDSLLESPDEDTTSSALVSAMFYCKTCSFDCQTLETFRKHLSSKKHLLEEETTESGNRELDPATRIWEKNYKAKPEYAHANIGVWWNMDHCPIPEGYDARRIRPSLEAAFRSLGYHGPVSIIAFGDHKLTPDHVLQVLSSTGIDVAHSIPEKRTGRMYSDMLRWKRDNPPPATLMLVSDLVDHLFSHVLVHLQQRPAPAKYNLCLAYSYRPCKMSVLVTCAEWLWDSLLAATVSETGESGQSTGMFYCKLCFCDCNGLDDFRKHLASDGHSREEQYILEDILYCEQQRELLIKQEKEEKRLRKMQESIIPDRLSRKASSQTDATQEKKNVVVASSLNSAAPPFNPSGSSSNLAQKDLQAGMGRLRVHESPYK